MLKKIADINPAKTKMLVITKFEYKYLYGII